MTHLNAHDVARLAQRATSGRWSADESFDGIVSSDGTDILFNSDLAVSWQYNDADVEFAAAAPDMAELITTQARRIEELEAENAKLTESLDV